MVKDTLESIIVKYINELISSGIKVEKAILFGSRNNGDYTDDSDIDLLVISPLFDGDYSREDIIQLWKTAAKIDSRIEPVHCGSRQWEHDDSSAIIEIARREGKIIHAA